MTRSVIRAVSAAAMAVTAPAAMAQEPMFSGAATQPSPGQVTVRTQLLVTHLGADPTAARREVEDYRVTTTVTAGLSRDLAFSLSAPVAHRRIDTTAAGESDTQFGVDGLSATLRWRVYKEDTGPIDTFRVALLGGMNFPLPGPISAEGFNPSVGAVATWIRGRHGFNLGAQYTITTDGKRNPIFPGESLADYLRADASYLFRLAPERYTAETGGAWYAALELNGRYETNGDGQVFLSPGVLYEARTFALEAAVQLPVWQSLSRRPESRFTIVFGVRLLF